MKPEKSEGGLAAFLKRVPTDRLKQLLADAQAEIDKREPKEAADMSESEFRAFVEKQLFKSKPNKKED
jgi:hypothetical protein